MIKATHPTKTFTRMEGKKKRTEFRAVDDISLEIHSGEILGVLGPNGAGKTTLLRMLGKLMAPTSGHMALSTRLCPSAKPIRSPTVYSPLSTMGFTKPSQ